MSKRSCVCKCAGGGTLYKFPSEKEMSRRLEWMTLLGVDVNKETKELYACERHFSARYRNIRRLSNGAVPDMNLKGKSIKTSGPELPTLTVNFSNQELKIKQSSLDVQPKSKLRGSSRKHLSTECFEVPMMRLPTIKQQHLNSNIFQYFAKNIVKQLEGFSEEIAHETMLEIHTLLLKRKVELTSDQLLCVDKQQLCHESEKDTGNESSTSISLIKKENIANDIVKELEGVSEKTAYQVMAYIQALLTKRKVELIRSTRTANDQLLCANKKYCHETGKAAENVTNQTHSTFKESMDFGDNIKRFQINSFTS